MYKTKEMGVSKNRGTPKWMVYNGKPYENGMIWGYHYFRKHPNNGINHLVSDAGFQPSTGLCFSWSKSLGLRLPITQRFRGRRLPTPIIPLCGCLGEEKLYVCVCVFLFRGVLDIGWTLAKSPKVSGIVFWLFVWRLPSIKQTSLEKESRNWLPLWGQRSFETHVGLFSSPKINLDIIGQRTYLTRESAFPNQAHLPSRKHLKAMYGLGESERSLLFDAS